MLKEKNIIFKTHLKDYCSAYSYTRCSSPFMLYSSSILVYKYIQLITQAFNPIFVKIAYSKQNFVYKGIFTCRIQKNESSANPEPAYLGKFDLTMSLGGKVGKAQKLMKI